MIQPYRILNQHGAGACTGYALAGACEALLRRELSPEWGWALGRAKQGTWPQDTGTPFYVVADEAHRRGMALAADYNPSSDPRDVSPKTLPFDFRPIPKDSTWGRPSVDAMRKALDSGRPVLVAMTITEGWQALSGPLDTHRYRGRLKPGYVLAAGHGQHAMWLRGYTGGAFGGFDAVNSFGVDFGDNGIGRLPFDVATNDIYWAAEILRIGDIYMDDDYLVKALESYRGRDDEFAEFMRGMGLSSREWAAFNRFLERAGMTVDGALSLCSTLKFERVSDLVGWVDSLS